LICNLEAGAKISLIRLSLINEFIQLLSPLTDYSGDTVVSSKHGPLSRTSSSSEKDGGRAVQEDAIGSRLRLHVRPKITLLLRRPLGGVKTKVRK
jgi:hypothetical protein